MDTTAFCYWLHGFFEISDSNILSETQVKIIKDHLDLVFNKVTPNRNIKEEISTIPPSVWDCKNKDTEEEGNWQKFWGGIQSPEVTKAINDTNKGRSYSERLYC